MGFGGVVGGVGNTPVKKPDPRFRSFAERYVVARAEFFRTDPEGHAADQWECLLDAKRVYLMARRMSINVEPGDDA